MLKERHLLFCGVSGHPSGILFTSCERNAADLHNAISDEASAIVVRLGIEYSSPPVRRLAVAGAGRDRYRILGCESRIAERLDDNQRIGATAKFQHKAGGRCVLHENL